MGKLRHQRNTVVEMLQVAEALAAPNASCKCARGWSGPACLSSNGTVASPKTGSKEPKVKGKKKGSALASAAGNAAADAGTDDDSPAPTAAAIAVGVLGGGARLDTKSVAASAGGSLAESN